MTADNKNASDSEDLRENWRVLSSKFQIELAICIGAASRRGLIGDDPNDRHRLDPAFQVVGLGQLVEAITSSDRFITFAP
jgi:tRNA 2-thiouridine synthesizing protein D